MRARDILRNAPGCLVIDKREDGGYVTPYECVGEDATYISRIREDGTIENGLQMWVVSTICARARRSTRCRSQSA
jgi:aspartate-semialdehyde dehydrogenase